MRGGIDHLMINCNDFEAAVRFYSLAGRHFTSGAWVFAR